MNDKHYLIKHKPNFLSCELKLSEDSKRFFAQGKPGQGYIGLVDLEEGIIHLVPSFNKDDGLLRENNEGAAFSRFAESRGGLGKLGDLHQKACQGIGTEFYSRSGKRGRVLGFGIWKGGCSVKLVSHVPEAESALIPNEYLLHQSQGQYKLTYVRQDRSTVEIDISRIPKLESFLSNIILSDMTEEEKSIRHRKIEKIITEYHITLHPKDTPNKIKYAKNRSTSQNTNAIEFDENYLIWFNANCRDHGVHATNQCNDPQV